MTWYEVGAAIVNKRGLHARAAARFVTLAETFRAELEVSRDGQNVPAGSIMGLLLLGAGLGTQLVIRGQGDEAVAGVDALVEFINAGFGEGL